MIRILVAIKESAGDIFLITGCINSLKKKYSNSRIYVACDKQYHSILSGNPDIFGVLEFHESMYGYRNYTKWAFQDNPFDIVFSPAVLTQQFPHNWLNGEYSVFLGQFYANQMNVPFGECFIALDDSIR